MKLFFDIESTGLPLQPSFGEWAPPEHLEKYATSRIIEIGIIIVHKGKIIETYNSIVKPDNFTKLIPKITEITGITDKQIIKEGKDFKQVIKEIKPLFDKSDSINSYNIGFDRNVLLSELYRINDINFIRVILDMKYECTYHLSKKILYLESYKLEKVYKELFKKDPAQDHRAYNDAVLCMDVYYKLKELYKNRLSEKNRN
mgnify:CR=1 FL=1